jgi:hypothetical protein
MVNSALIDELANVFVGHNTGAPYIITNSENPITKK